MAFRILAIDHVVLRAADAPAMIAFYRDVLGCAVERSKPDIGLFQLRAGASLIDIFDAGGAATGGGRNMDHFCLRIDPFDEAELRGHLGRHGIEAGDVKMRYGAEGNGPSLYIEDPEGNTVELKGPPAAAPNNHAQHEGSDDESN